MLKLKEEDKVICLNQEKHIESNDVKENYGMIINNVTKYYKSFKAIDKVTLKIKKENF